MVGGLRSGLSRRSKKTKGSAQARKQADEALNEQSQSRLVFSAIHAP